MGFNFGRFVRDAFNPKSGLRRTISKVAGGIDRGIMTAGTAIKKIAPAAAAIPEAAPVVAGVTGALNSYERIRDAIKG